MKIEDLRHFRRELLLWLHDLRHQAENTIRERELPELRLPDPTDQAAADINRSLSLRLRDREAFLIRKIEQSLKDIQDGTYGICAVCEESIGLPRLRARPVARHCIRCKTAMERGERQLS